MKFSSFKTLLGTAATLCILAVAGQQAQAGTLHNEWTYSIDSFKDGTEGGTIGSKSQFEFYGMAFKEVENRVYFAVNSNLSLNGYALSGARNGKISYGDLFLNFANTSRFDAANSKSQLFAIRFDRTNDTTFKLGLYGNVQATSLTTKNSGYSSIQSHTNTISHIQADSAQKYTAVAGKYEIAVQNLNKTTQDRTKKAQERDETDRSYTEAVSAYNTTVQQKNEAVQSYNLTVQQKNAAQTSYNLAVQQKNAAQKSYDSAVKNKQNTTLLEQNLKYWTQEVTTRKSEWDRLTKEVTTRQEDKDRLTKEVTTSQQKRDQLSRSLKTLNSAVATLDQSLTKLNQDVTKLSAEKEALDPTGMEASFGDLAATSTYFNTQAAAPTTISSGKFLGAISSMISQTDLDSMGLDFSHFGAKGTQTFGFSVSKSLLPEGNFMASLFAECGNDGMALSGNLKDVPEPSAIVGLLTTVGLVAGARRLRRRYTQAPSA